MHGKKVVNNYYWHCSLTTTQSPRIQQVLSEAEAIARLTANSNYNVIKYDGKSRLLSLLWYPFFFEEPFPTLQKSYRIDLDSKKIEKRCYESSLNPPILHRKELLLRKDDPRIPQFQELTETAELLGLFENTIQIGFKQAWDTLINEKGFQLIGHQFVSIGNDEANDQPFEQTKSNAIARHLTALSRSNLSAPMQCLARHGFLDGSLSVFDYGCGKGDDIRNLSTNAILVSGWDPYFAPEQSKQSADIVNLGFVINVIENYQERLEALVGAYELAHKVLVVSTMLFNQNALKGQAFNDGVITQRNTFQKYFTQTELKEFIGDTLETDAIPVAPGIFFIFKDQDAEQRFLLGRQRRSQRNVLRLSRRPFAPALPKLSRHEKKYIAFKHLIDPLWLQTLELGRLPDKSEIDSLIELIEAFGTINKAQAFMLQQHDESLLDQVRQSRIDDLITFFALQTFAKRKPYKRLETGLQKDIKAFFGDYPNAIATAKSSLFQISNAELIASACQQATERGLGFLDQGEALHIHTTMVQELPALLRIYIGCATVLYGDIEQADLIKIHIQSGKLSLMRYDDFVNQPLPRLLERVKINLREQTFDLYQYGEEFEPTYLYLKSRYINEEFQNYAEQLEFDEQIQALELFDLNEYGPKPHEFRDTLAKARLEICDFKLIRSQQIPDINENCGCYLSYKDLVACGETQAATGIYNHPVQPDSYNALYELAINVLDPVIDYYGMIRLTYGFCSHELGKHIKNRVAPKLDQHAAHERNSKNNLICSRLGAAVDFIVDDENMREVADWIASNTDFDRLYFYGDDRPIHVSYGPEHKKEYVDLLLTEQGRLIPKKRY